MVKLSIVSRGRNDNYGNLYKEKVQFNINKHISNFTRLGLTPEDIEIVFSDWGTPPFSAEPLYYALSNINKKGFVRFILVPKDVTDYYDPEETHFSFVHSINSSAVRAKGVFVLHIDFDAFFPYESFKNLWEYINKYDQNLKIHHYFNRINVHDWENILDKDINIYEMDDLEKIPEVKPKMDRRTFEGAAAGLMMTKEAWNLTGGYDERMIYWGFQDTDLFLRLCDANYIPQILEDVPTYHFEHGRIMCSKSNNISMMSRKPKTINPNGENWGLKQFNFGELIV